MTSILSQHTPGTIESIHTLLESPFRLVNSFDDEILIKCFNEPLSVYKERQEAWLDRRFNLLSKAKTDKALQDTLIHVCKENPIFFINLTGVAFNPIDGGLIPLVLFNRQVQAILAMNLAEKQGKYLTMLKSRYVGASVFSTAYLVHSLIFKQDWSGLLLSRVLSLVDGSGDADTLFAKIDLATDYLPPWMKPKLQRKLGIVRNESMNSVIKGTGGKNAGRGGRASVVIIDEAAFIEGAAQVFAALSNTTKCVIMISTPNGRNEFYRMVTNKAIPSFTYHWSSDPRRDQDWYEGEKAKFSPHIVAQELDLSFDGSQENSIIAAYKLESTIQHEVSENTNSELVMGLDIAAGGANDSVMAIRKGSELVSITSLDKGLSLTQQARFIDNFIKENRVAKVIFDSSGVGLGFKAALDDIYDGSYAVVAFLGGSKASDRITPSGKEAYQLYGNARSEAWHLLKDAIDYTYNYSQGKIPQDLYDESRTIKLLPVPELLSDLSKPGSVITTSGKLLVESKQSMSARGVSSPDYGDALAYCFYEGVSYHDTSWLED